LTFPGFWLWIANGLAILDHGGSKRSILNTELLRSDMSHANRFYSHLLSDWNAWNGLIRVMNGAKRWNGWND
jgi:hypothetical protein